MQPYEMVASPYTAYLAPTGTAMPKIDDIASGFAPAWVVLGTSGNKNYTDTGVVVTHSQTVSSFTPAGSTTPRKAWRTGEELTVALTLADVSPEQYAKLIDDATLTTVAASGAVAGEKSFPLMRGVQVKMFALLVRGISSVDESLNAQYELPAVYQSGNPAPSYSKQNPAELAAEFHAFELTPGVLGTLRIQTAAKV